MKAYILIGILAFSVIRLNGQVQNVGAWRDHLPYQSGKKIIKIGSKLYCSTELSIFTYDTIDNSLEKLTKINGLSDVGIATLEYSEEKNTLVIAYSNGNIDLIRGNTITNIADLKRKIILWSKKANHIFFHGNFAFISYAFGIIVLDLDKNEIKDTYNISEGGASIAVYSLTADNSYFYAATEKGIFKASIDDPFLVNYTHWQRILFMPQPNGKYNHITNFNNSIIANYRDNTQNSDNLYVIQNESYSDFLVPINSTINEIRAIDNNLLITCDNKIYVIDNAWQLKSEVIPYNSAKSSLIDENGTIWAADNWGGITKKTTEYWRSIAPNGPFSNSVRNMKYINDMLLVTAGQANASWTPMGRNGELNIFKNEVWTYDIKYNAKDYFVVTADPVEKSKIYIGTWGYGVMVYENNLFVDSFYIYNSALQAIPGTMGVRIGGITFDKSNNLWMISSEVASPVLVLKTDGTWKSFEYQRYMGVKYTIGDIHCDAFGQFWVVLPRSNGLWAFDVNGTIDDEADDRHFTNKFFPKDVFGETINNVFCVTSDKDGNVWVGTNRGPVVYSNPSEILSGVDGVTDGYQPTISRSDTSGLADAVLGSESINSIAVDGANRKWFGTEKGGAYLFSADGTKEILHFNTDNSPLISNNVLSIAINDKTGEVYFGTDIGIMSYRSTATEPLNELDNAYVFPNPVRPEYTGDVIISKLVENTYVKITDISGNLVYQTKSLGGQAIWDGKNKNGKKVATGVYLIFLTNEDGSETKVIKLLVVK
jgi:ribosomal protein S11